MTELSSAAVSMAWTTSRRRYSGALEPPASAARLSVTEGCSTIGPSSDSSSAPRSRRLLDRAGLLDGGIEQQEEADEEQQDHQVLDGDDELPGAFGEIHEQRASSLRAFASASSRPMHGGSWVNKLWPCRRSRPSSAGRRAGPGLAMPIVTFMPPRPRISPPAHDRCCPPFALPRRDFGHAAACLAAGGRESAADGDPCRRRHVRRAARRGAAGCLDAGHRGFLATGVERHRTDRAGAARRGRAGPPQPFGTRGAPHDADGALADGRRGPHPLPGLPAGRSDLPRPWPAGIAGAARRRLPCRARLRHLADAAVGDAAPVRRRARPGRLCDLDQPAGAGHQCAGQLAARLRPWRLPGARPDRLGAVERRHQLGDAARLCGGDQMRPAAAALSDHGPLVAPRMAAHGRDDPHRRAGRGHDPGRSGALCGRRFPDGPDRRGGAGRPCRRAADRRSGLPGPVRRRPGRDDPGRHGLWRARCGRGPGGPARRASSWASASWP